MVESNIKFNLNFTVSKIINFLAMIGAFIVGVWLSEPEIPLIIVPIALGATVNRQYQQRKKIEAEVESKTKQDIKPELLGG